jgi:hypothetical protein
MKVMRMQWSLFLNLLCLPAPFVWMKIGPEGYKYYGPDVPDIWILGAYILGKDTRWPPIGLAWKWQLAFILITAFCTWCFLHKPNKLLLWFNLCLLILFPLWLEIYSSGVINNSDGADLSVYPMPGLLLWAGIICLHGVELWKSRRSVS